MRSLSRLLSLSKYGRSAVTEQVTEQVAEQVTEQVAEPVEVLSKYCRSTVEVRSLSRSKCGH